MPAIENVTRRGAVYWWRRRVRFGGRLNDTITVATTVSLLTKDQYAALSPRPVDHQRLLSRVDSAGSLDGRKIQATVIRIVPIAGSVLSGDA